MGKRKSARKVQVKKREKLEEHFDCPFCSEAKSTDFKKDKNSWLGVISCRICKAKYSTKIHKLSAAIDVYASWIEAIDKQDEGEVASPEEEDRDPYPSYKSGRDVVNHDDDDLFGDSKDNDDLFGDDFKDEELDFMKARPKGSPKKQENYDDELFGEEEDYNQERAFEANSVDYEDEEEEDFYGRKNTTHLGSRSEKNIEDEEDYERPSFKNRSKIAHSEDEEEEQEEEEDYGRTSSKNISSRGKRYIESDEEEDDDQDFSSHKKHRTKPVIFSDDDEIDYEKDYQ